MRVFFAAGLLFLGLPVLAQDAQDAQQAALPRAEVKLLEPGDEPRQQLRYHPEIGQAERAVIEMVVSSVVTMGGMEMPAQEFPTTKMTVVQTPASVDEAGNYTIQIRIAKFDADGEGMMADMVRQSMQPLVGAAGAAQVTPAGESVGFKMQNIDAAGPMLAQMESMSSQASQLGAIFPYEPVGPGARWEVTQQIENAGIRLKQTMLVTLKSIEGSVVALDMAMSQAADPQDFAPPGIPPGMEVDLTSLTGSGEGTMQIDLSRLLPSQSSMDATTSIEMSMTMQGQQQEMAQSMTTSIVVTGELATDEEPADAPEEEPAEDANTGGG